MRERESCDCCGKSYQRPTIIERPMDKPPWFYGPPEHIANPLLPVCQCWYERCEACKKCPDHCACSHKSTK